MLCAWFGLGRSVGLERRTPGVLRRRSAHFQNMRCTNPVPGRLKGTHWKQEDYQHLFRRLPSATLRRPGIPEMSESQLASVRETIRSTPGHRTGNDPFSCGHCYLLLLSGG